MYRSAATMKILRRIIMLLRTVNLKNKFLTLIAPQHRAKARNSEYDAL